MSKLKLDYCPDIKYGNCTLFSPKLQFADDEPEKLVDIVEVTTIEECPRYFILPQIKNKYSLRVGFELTSDEYFWWKLGGVEIGQLLENPKKWFKFAIPNTLPLWRVTIQPETSFLSIEEYSKPKKSYMNAIPMTATRKE